MFHRTVTSPNIQAGPLTCNLTDPESLQNRLIECFPDYDTELNGWLSRENIFSIFNDACRQNDLPNCKRENLDDIIKMLDDDGNGQIEYYELAQNIEQLAELISMPLKGRV